MHDPDNGIASRDDLTLAGKPCCADGAIDAKVVGAADVRALRFEGVCGPTHDAQPVFQWTSAYAATPHHGQPPSFPFGWTMLFG